jgi:hypothetical protein
MYRMLTLGLAELLQLYLRSAFGYTHTRTIVPMSALTALKPNMFSFALLLCHKPSGPTHTTGTPYILPTPNKLTLNRYNAAIT